MPELPEVETTKASLAPLLDQQVLRVLKFASRACAGRFPPDLSKLVGRAFNLTQTPFLNTFWPFLNKTRSWHLGMSGSFRICEVGETLRKHDHLIIRFEDVELRYHDPRRFGCIFMVG